MKIFCSRVYVLLCMLAIKWQCLAQATGGDFDDDYPELTRKKDNTDELQEMIEEGYGTMPIHIRFSDVLTVVFILIAGYVFGRIWKGCSYLIIILAAVFYFITH